MSKTATNEFIVRYMDQFEDYQAILNTSCKTWNSVAKNQLKRTMKYMENVWENEDKKVRYFTVNFQNGSHAYFLFIPRYLTMFEIHEQIREAFMEGIKDNTKLSMNVIDLEHKLQKQLIMALSGAVELYQWDYPKYGKKAKRKRKEKKSVMFYTDLNNADQYVERGKIISEGTNLARTLCTTPTNHMTSKHLVEEARKVAKRLYGVKFEFINERQLKDMGAGAFLSVIQGTKGSDGGIAHLRYRTRAKDKPTVAIVGKGVTFDTGGYDVKTDGYMEGMHRDMTGSAVALGLFQSLVKNKSKINLDLYLSIGENLISEVAYKPNDVVVALDGSSIEIKNTDAEGRMLMIDTFTYANQEKPDVILDFSTLTGAIMDAIGTQYAGLFTNDETLAIIGKMAGETSGERVWPFPVTSDFDQELKSEVADIAQCQDSEHADHIYAACFLKYFAKKTPWIHIDLACEKNEGGLGLVNTDINGFGVRWGFDFVQHIIKSGDIND